MNFLWYDTALLIASELGTIALIVTLLRKGEVKRWPSLFGLMIFDLLLNATLPAVAHVYRIYFYTYWIGAGIRAFISLGLLYDTIKSIPGVTYLPRNIAALFGSFCATVGVGTFVASYNFQSSTYDLLENVTKLNVCVSTAWISFALALLGCISFLGLGWPDRSIRVMSGILITGLGTMLTAHTYTWWPAIGNKIDACNSLLYLAVLFFWVQTFATEPTPQPSPIFTTSTARESTTA